MSLPLNPTLASSAVATDMGVIGYATTGGSFYNDLSSPSGDVALYNEGMSLDSCAGHSSENSQYHYHANILCVDDAADADVCSMIGYARDGVPIYGYCNDADGTQFTSCYAIKSGYSESEITIAAGTFMSASMEDYYEFDSDGDCNLDEANGISSIKKLKDTIIHSFSFRCCTPNNWRVLLLYDHHLPMGS